MPSQKVHYVSRVQLDNHCEGVMQEGQNMGSQTVDVMAFFTLLFPLASPLLFHLFALTRLFPSLLAALLMAFSLLPTSLPASRNVVTRHFVTRHLSNLLKSIF